MGSVTTYRDNQPAMLIREGSTMLKMPRRVHVIHHCGDGKVLIRDAGVMKHVRPRDLLPLP